MDIEKMQTEKMQTEEKIKYFLDEVKLWSGKLKVCPLDIQFQNMKQWGNCSSDGVLRFNNELLFKRKELQTYVIVHELLHLKIPNHGKLFQALMSLHVPGWRELDRELNQSPELSLFSP